MKRWKKVVIWISSIIVVLGITGLFVANYAIDKFLSALATESVVVEETAESNGQVVEEGTVVAETPVTDAKDVSGSVKQNEDTASDEGNKSSSAEVSDEKEEPGSSSNNGSKDNKSNTEKQQSESPKKELDLSYSAEVSGTKAEAIKENVTVKEKAQVTSILLGELDMDDIKRLQELASGGLSIEEKKEARRILLEKVSPEQYNSLSSIAKKYGASEGKSYDQVSKEEGLAE